MSLTLDRNILSLTVGRAYQLTVSPAQAVAWSSSNPRVRVTPIGRVIATEDYLRPDGQAVITATSLDGSESASCAVTIVDWPANRFELEHIDTLTDRFMSVAPDGTQYAVNLRAYESADEWASETQLPDAPEAFTKPQLLFTSRGVFGVASVGSIYRSTDGLASWTKSFDGALAPLFHGFAAVERPDGAVVVFSGEYDVDPDARHRLIRGVITSAGETWSVAKEWFSRNEYTADPDNSPSASHIHVAQVDPYTGHVWIGTGDHDHESFILTSDDYGETLRVIGTGGQKWRTLAFWFTEKYIYWNMDSGQPQSVWRLARSNLAAQSPETDLSEKVVDLLQASHWFTALGVDTVGREVVYMGVAAEGQLRDWRPRIFMFREREDETVDTQEVLTVLSQDPETYLGFAQLEPRYCVGDVLYARARQLAVSGVRRYRLARVPDALTVFVPPGAFVGPGAFV